MTLRDHTLFITGASRGIGLAIALRAARDGANIVIAAKTEKPHPKLPGTIFTAAEQIASAGGTPLPLAIDVRDEAQVRDAIAEASLVRRLADLGLQFGRTTSAVGPLAVGLAEALRQFEGAEIAGESHREFVRKGPLHARMVAEAGGRLGIAFETGSSGHVSTADARRVLAMAPQFGRPRRWIIGSPIDIEVYRRDAEAAARFRQRIGLGPEDFILTAGALSWEKRHDVVIEAVASLGAAAPPVVMCGMGRESQALAAQAAARGVRLFLPGQVPTQEMPGGYTAATIVAHPAAKLGKSDARFGGSPTTIPASINAGNSGGA